MMRIKKGQVVHADLRRSLSSCATASYTTPAEFKANTRANLEDAIVGQASGRTQAAAPPDRVDQLK